MPEIDAVVIMASWESHLNLACDAMRAGKYTAVEVAGAYSVEDCWKLVRTHEETGVPCMMLENCCFGRDELMVLNMVRRGLFGEVVHCQGGYRHDLREEVSTGREMRHYRFRNYLYRNCENYPTHELGPIANVLDINRGNRMLTLVSVASKAAGLHEYLLREKRPGLRRCKHEFCPGRRGDDHHQMRPGRDDLPDAGHHFAAGLFPRIPCAGDKGHVHGGQQERLFRRQRQRV